MKPGAEGGRRARPAPAVVDVRGLTIERSRTILEGIDWRVERGQHWAILGANGSGKTSLLCALAGYLTPTEGEVSVLGETYGESDWGELRKVIGMVSSSVKQRVEPGETALEVVISGAEAMINYWGDPAPGEVRRARRILRQVECLHLAHQPWLHLSQGERQRLLIGRALMGRVRLMVLDEPCAGIDPVAREAFLGFVERLATRRGAPTLLLVTHHVEEITPAFGHVLLLRGGRRVAGGPIAVTLNGRNLTATFGAPVRLARRAGRYTMSVGEGGGGAFGG